MKNTLVAFMVVAAGWWLTAARYRDVVSDLGMTKEQIQNSVLDYVRSPDQPVYIPYKTRQLARQIPAGSRAAAVQALGQVVRAYAESAAFKTKYQDQLKQEYQISDGATQRAQEGNTQAAMRQQVAAATAAYSQMPTSALTMLLQSQIEGAREMLASAESAEKAELTKNLAQWGRLQALSKTKPEEFRKQYVANLSQTLNQQLDAEIDRHSGDAARAKAEAQEYEKRLAEYKAASDVNKLLKQRLQAFIALTRSIDFDAPLTKRGSHMVFVNPAYESKPAHWKQLYRLGKEPVSTAQSIAQEWLAQLEQKR